jgi:Flp pilus assembly protein protease CpaA
MKWRSALKFFIAYVVLLIFMLSIPMFIHRRSFDEAFTAWYKDRTAENEAALRVQKRKNGLFELEFCAVGAFIVLVVGYGLYKLVRLTTRPRKG